MSAQVAGSEPGAQQREAPDCENNGDQGTRCRECDSKASLNLIFILPDSKPAPQGRIDETAFLARIPFDDLPPIAGSFSEP